MTVANREGDYIHLHVLLYVDMVLGADASRVAIIVVLYFVDLFDKNKNVQRLEIIANIHTYAKI